MRIAIDIPDEDWNKLTKLSKQMDVSIEELIRAAISRFLREQE